MICHLSLHVLQVAPFLVFPRSMDVPYWISFLNLVLDFEMTLDLVPSPFRFWELLM